MYVRCEREKTSARERDRDIEMIEVLIQPETDQGLALSNVKPWRINLSPSKCYVIEKVIKSRKILRSHNSTEVLKKQRQKTCCRVGVGTHPVNLRRAVSVLHL